MGPDETVSKFCAAAQLLQQWCLAKYEQREMDDSILVDVRVPHRSPLAGHELKTFLAQEEAKRHYQKQQEEKRAMLREVEIAKGQLRLGEDEPTSTSTMAGTTTGMAGEASQGSSAAAANLATSGTSSSAAAAVKGRPTKKSRFDSSLFLKFSKPLHCKFVVSLCVVWYIIFHRPGYKLNRCTDIVLIVFPSLFLALPKLQTWTIVVTFQVREEAVGVGQSDSTAKYGIGESIGRAGEVLEDDYGIAVKPERFTDIVSGVDPSKFVGGTGRIGEEVMRRGFGYSAAGGPGGKSGGAGGGGNNANDVSSH